MGLYKLIPQFIAWMSHAQRCVALSTEEAESIVASDSSREAVWLICIMGDLGIKYVTPTLHCDGICATQLACKPASHPKAKHTEVRYHFIT